MHLDVHDLRNFYYRTQLGRVAQKAIRDKVVELTPGECIVIPRGVEHRSCATEPTEFMIFEPMNVLSTGNPGKIDTYTAPNGVGV